MIKDPIRIYTDGSCHPQSKVGCWAAIIITARGNITIHGLAENTTNQRVELLAVIYSIEYLEKNISHFGGIEVYTDSQYVAKLPSRATKLKKSAYCTSKGTLIRNADLVKQFVLKTDMHSIRFKKVAAHQKKDNIINYNREVDKLARKTLRKHLKHNKSNL